MNTVPVSPVLKWWMERNAGPIDLRGTGFSVWRDGRSSGLDALDENVKDAPRKPSPDLWRAKKACRQHHRHHVGSGVRETVDPTHAERGHDRLGEKQVCRAAQVSY